MSKPPKFASRLLKWFCPSVLQETIEGDLLEQFQLDVESYGIRRAQYRYTWNVIRFFRPEIIFRNRGTQQAKSYLFKSHFKIALRRFRKYPTHTGINVTGLVIGIASALIILSIIRFELSFDSFHSNAENIYRLVRVSEVEGATEYRTGVSYPVAPALKNEIPGLEHITSVLYWSWGGIQVSISDSTQTPGLYRENGGFALVEPSFFEIFDFQGTDFRWIEGNPEASLTEPNAIVLTETMAGKYFPKGKAVGQTLVIDQYWHCTVTGIVSDFPDNTDFPFRILLSYSTLRPSIGTRMDNWVSVGVNQNYLVLPSGYTRESFEQLVHEVHQAHAPQLAEMRKYKLQPLKEVHRDPHFDNYNRRVVSEERLLTLGIIGAFLLLVACINYINLSTAQSYLRSKEVGVRKVMGGQRKELILQFLCEAFVLTLTSGLIGLLLAELLIANFQQLLSVPGSGPLMSDPFILWSFLGIIAIVALLAGLYPALVISGFRPVHAVKKTLGGDQGSFRFRKILVTFQFSITQVSLIATLVVILQMNYLEKADLGFEKEAIINITVPEDVQRQQLFIQLLRDKPQVAKASLSSTVPSGAVRNANYWDIKRPGWEDQSLVFEIQRTDDSYLNLYGIELISGRNFRKNDTSYQVIINNTLSEKLGFVDPAEAIGETLLMGSKHAEVIGVMQDFHTKSLKEEVDKVVLIQSPEDYEVASVKLSHTEAMDKALADIRATWTALYPDFAFNYTFFDESIAAYYAQEQKFSSLFKIFSTIFLIIGCLGLYGLISFVIHKKLKEVAIRKVFGAKLVDIALVISKDYMKLITLAFLIATPVAFYLMTSWLENYRFHTDISWWVLILPGLLVFIIAVLAVSGLTLRTAKSNPAGILQDE